MRPAVLLAVRAGVVVAAVAGWELATRGAGSPFFPPPSRIVTEMHGLWFTGPAGHLWLNHDAVGNLLPSLGRLLAGWAAASVLGIALGVALGRSVLSDYAEPMVHFGRAIPPPALVPVFLVLFKIGPQTQLATIVFGVIWPVLVNSVDGARYVGRRYLDTAEVFRIPRTRRLLRIILPGAAPKILAGLRLSLSLALIMMVISEFVGSTDGIGRELQVAQTTFDTTTMWAIIVLLGVLGVALNALFLLAERRVLAWQRTPVPEHP